MNSGLVNGQLGWLGIVRLGLVQTALGAIIVLTTSTLNRVMVVELALPAMLPGFLVAVHHVVQLARPRIGHGSDVGGRRTPWIVGGMLVLASGGFLAALGTTLMADHLWLGTAVGFLGFFGIGLGSGATGTSLLVLLAKQVAPERKPAAATIVWFMMIAGFAVTAGVAGQFLDPYTSGRLLGVTGTVSIGAMLLTILAIRGLEPRPVCRQPAHPDLAGLATAHTTGGDSAAAGTPASHGFSAKIYALEIVATAESGVIDDDVQGGHLAASQASSTNAKPDFRRALREVWSEPAAQRFTVFVFISMLAYSLQDLILEPFAGLAFGMTPGQSTALAGTQHGGVLGGMLAVALSGSLFKRASALLLRRWLIAGCIASALALGALAWGGLHPSGWQLSLNVFALGFANGAFAVAAIASMMMLASQGSAGKEGLRMGLWGAAQAIAFALGGFSGTVAADLARQWLTEPALAYGAVFVFEALLFLVAAQLGASIQVPRRADGNAVDRPRFGDIALHEMMDGGAS